MLRHGKYDEAIRLLNKALEEEKEEAGLYVNRGGVCVQSILCHSLSCGTNGE